MFSGLRPFADNRPFGVEWPDDIPAHWKVRRIQSAVDMRVSNVDKHVRDGDIPVRMCNYVDVYRNDRITKNIPFMQSTATIDEIRRFQIKPGDVLITKDSEAWDDIGVPALVENSSEGVVCGYHLALLRPSKTLLNGAYLFRVLQCSTIACQLHMAANGVTRYGLSHHAIKSALLPIPPLVEQIAIVNYLDHVDQRIHRYIDGKQRLIALLEEQRQAVIHRAVTRCLDTNTRRKPSGIEWLGDVPAHWQMRRLQSVVDMKVSNVDKHVKKDEIPVRLCNYVDVYKNDRITENIPFMRATAVVDEIDRFRIEIGDVLITKDSEAWDDIGVPALVEYSAEDVVCGYHLALLRPSQTLLNGAYLFRALQCPAITCQFHMAANGVTRYGLSHHAIKSALLPVPPFPEQVAIVEHLDKATADIDAAIDRTHREIELMREYRERLIADVVTGKLDARKAAERLPEPRENPIVA